jgi:hypothetical protein
MSTSSASRPLGSQDFFFNLMQGTMILAIIGIGVIGVVVTWGSATSRNAAFERISADLDRPVRSAPAAR